MSLLVRRVVLPQESGNLTGELFIPEGAEGVVVTAYDTVGPCCSPQSRDMARGLVGRQVAVLLLGLQTGAEADELLAGWGVDDAEGLRLAADRLRSTARFLTHDPQTDSMPIGLFGTGTAAAASFLLGARPPPHVMAVASCGGQPWLAGEAVEEVEVPTLLVVGGEDDEALPATLRMSKRLKGATSLRLVPHASRTFAEPGALDDLSRICGDWFHDRFAEVVLPRTFGWADPEGRWV